MKDEFKPEERNNALIIRFLSGDINQSEVVELQEWINQSDENKAEFVKARNLWMATAQIKGNYVVDTDQALSELNHKIDMQNKFSSSVHPNFGRFLKIAASFLLILCFGSLSTYFLMKSHTQKGRDLVFVFAPQGGKAMTVLPDGTQVWLNAESNLSYNPSTYGDKTREVNLIGEGFFKVTSNAKKPFIVKAKNLNIKAVGTEFNVKAYPEEKTVETTLVKGIVKIEGSDQYKRTFSITMVPKQKITFSPGRIIIDSSFFKNPSNLNLDKLNKIKLEKCPDNQLLTPIVKNEVKTSLYTSWKDDKWVFEGEEIGDLAILLERKYNVKIKFSAEELKHYRFTGTFQHETLEQVMQVLQLTAPLDYIIGKGEVKLTLDPEAKLKYKKLII